MLKRSSLRNRTEHRLAEKRSKRDVEWSEANVRELERHAMNTRPDRPLPAYVRAAVRAWRRKSA